jgi:hypothetical protein
MSITDTPYPYYVRLLATIHLTAGSCFAKESSWIG